MVKNKESELATLVEVAEDSGGEAAPEAEDGGSGGGEEGEGDAAAAEAAEEGSGAEAAAAEEEGGSGGGEVRKEDERMKILSFLPAASTSRSIDHLCSSLSAIQSALQF